MFFSQRIGQKGVRTQLQTESIDKILRTRLWNAIYTDFVTVMDAQYALNYGMGIPVKFVIFAERFWCDILQYPIDTLPHSYDTFKSYLRSWVFDRRWFEVYDLLETLIKVKSPLNKNRFINEVNQVLEEEKSGYRIIGKEVVPIVNDKELSEVESALKISENLRLEGVNLHLRSALDKLSDRKNPDYRNSIKESISAVESLARIITKNPKATLGSALDKMPDLHQALRQGISNIYGYASDEGGIRHALTETSKTDFEDAKYLFVMCSALINYLICKILKSKNKNSHATYNA